MVAIQYKQSVIKHFAEYKRRTDQSQIWNKWIWMFISARTSNHNACTDVKPTKENVKGMQKTAHGDKETGHPGWWNNLEAQSENRVRWKWVFGGLASRGSEKAYTIQLSNKIAIQAILLLWAKEVFGSVWSNQSKPLLLITIYIGSHNICFLQCISSSYIRCTRRPVCWHPLPIEPSSYLVFPFAFYLLMTLVMFRSREWNSKWKDPGRRENQGIPG